MTVAAVDAPPLLHLDIQTFPNWFHSPLPSLAFVPFSIFSPSHQGGAANCYELDSQSTLLPRPSCYSSGDWGLEKEAPTPPKIQVVVLPLFKSSSNWRGIEERVSPHLT